MREKTLNFLEAHQSEQPSTFVEDARWRKENEMWLKWSRGVALAIVDYMQDNGLSRSDIAAKLGVSPQYVSRILSGRTNFSFKSIAEIERKLGISCMEAVMGYSLQLREKKQRDCAAVDSKKSKALPYESLSSELQEILSLSEPLKGTVTEWELNGEGMHNK